MDLYMAKSSVEFCAAEVLRQIRGGKQSICLHNHYFHRLDFYLHYNIKRIIMKVV